MKVIANGTEIDIERYWRMHETRFRHSLAALRRHATGRILEIGGHPWAMTSMISEDRDFEVGGTVSAEEVTKWPDDIGLTKSPYELITPKGEPIRFMNYAFNVERTIVDLDEQFDAIVACEVIEHLVRSPHIMLLNMNRWLKDEGVILITTPNGAQFSNPLRLKNGRPAFRCYAYERHNCTFTLSQLTDLAERCGFRILESGYWNIYSRVGLSRLYDVAALLPGRYFREKFSRTIFLLAKKVENRSKTRGTPVAYIPNPDWEFVDP